MVWHNFVDKLTQLQQERQTQVALFLNPRPFLLPHPIQRYDDPYLPFSKAVIGATRDLVCAYVFDFAAYLGMGAAGAVALERSITYAAGTVTILHAPFTGTGYSAAADSTGFDVDAITLSHHADLPHYLEHAPHAAFVVGDADEANVPDAGGIFDLGQHCLALRDAQHNLLKLRLTDDSVLYADGTDAFAEKIRSAVEQLR